ncbi:hypothetical protein GOBAR_AA00374 [Gossypium barbadense]|uniref:Serine-threonine/tyrosine-protein kinase catalytic domain-containing protein n=1 Tax=Gossypium barbadense TaxID=3634 RepID=A0A2P5YX84_GOSBA|nr:hypothetical protein GOBAR_AA00374 [Gossypium barbadense]
MATSQQKASKESVLYSFGVVALEIACGRRSIEPKFHEPRVLLVQWVWESYRNGRVLDVTDKKIGIGFNSKQMECLVVVGLWCAHLCHNLRSLIRQVIQTLHFEAPLSNLSSTMLVLCYNAPIALGIGSSEAMCQTSLSPFLIN